MLEVNMLIKLNLFKSKVNKLVDKRDELIFKRQKIEDKKNLTNSRIENKVRDLENKAWRNQIIATNKIDDINRKLEKAERDIISEKDYVNSISTFKPEEISAKVRNGFHRNIPSELVNGRPEIKNPPVKDEETDEEDNDLDISDYDC